MTKGFAESQAGGKAAWKSSQGRGRWDPGKGRAPWLARGCHQDPHPWGRCRRDPRKEQGGPGEGGTQGHPTGEGAEVTSGRAGGAWPAGGCHRDPHPPREGTEGTPERGKGVGVTGSAPRGRYRRDPRRSRVPGLLEGGKGGHGTQEHPPQRAAPPQFVSAQQG